MIRFASSTALAVLLISAPAFAQTAPAPMETPPAATQTAPADAPMAAPATPTAPTTATAGAVQYVPAQTDGQWLASNVIGESVRGPNDERIGDISDLVVDASGNVVAAVIGVGGFLGIGEKAVAVPFANLQMSNERDEVITLSATKEQLEAAPEFRTLEDLEAERVANDPTANTANPTGGMPPAPARPAQ